MNLYHIDHLLQETPGFQEFLSTLIRDERARIDLMLPEAAYGVFAASVYDRLRRPILFVSSHPESAKRRHEQIRQWLENGQNTWYFPEIDLLGSEAEADPIVASERLRILTLLTDYRSVREDDGPAPLIVASALSLANRSPSREALAGRRLDIAERDSIKQVSLLEQLQSMGYAYDEVVETPGTFGKRGGIVDVFAAGCDVPVRIEFLGDEVESIREYDPKTQRSASRARSVRIAPLAGSLDVGDSNIIDYLPHDAILILDEPSSIESEVERIERQAAGLGSGDAVKGTGGGGRVGCLTWDQISAKLDGAERIVRVGGWGADAGLKVSVPSLPLESAPSYAARFSSFIDDVEELRSANKRILIASLQAERIRELLLEKGTDVHPVKSLTGLPAAGSLTLVQGSVDAGWSMKGEITVFTDLELFGIVKQRRSVKPRPVKHTWFLNDVSTGDLVVHVEHGIGLFAGVTRKVSAGVEREYLILEYAGGDTLYVPIEQVDRVGLYIGGGERSPSLSRLGSQEWNRARQKVKESVVNIAHELIDLYAGREASAGQVFSPDTIWQQELEASFPYVETPDQLEAMKAIKADMESSKPMDRLVCGDVGYGKTEIAVRAAFKAVMAGKQVAILVPTTILAQQHLDTFRDRMKAFPVKVEALSRFCSQHEQAEIIECLADGTVDICIGTHRLLQKDVVFKDLGLAIIDEEQRFGVAHKDYFKKMRQTVDVLTLSATPIPRTMHMALSGIRDLSTIETPPENRLPIVTSVGEYDGRLVREAILREMERDGQVFVVHNRVHSIGALANKIADLVPEARVTVAHGQMPEADLEQVMTGFMHGDSDVLLTTTIIESGLDMPNVNTLIVNPADNLGLTQLYQLRGRVGRGANTAYAYFLFNSDKGLTGQARERLKTIAQTTQLGAGFAIAMKDLEIRGAGNLLGVEQSGNIASVGFNYYCQLLAEAVEEIKAKREKRELPPKAPGREVAIDLKMPAFIPEYYVADTRSRFNLYQRLARASDLTAIEEIREELIDRFGAVPEEVENLLFVVEMKHLARAGGVESVFTNAEVITISTGDAAPPEMLSNFSKGKGIKVGNRQIRLDKEVIGGEWRSRLRRLISEMASKLSGAQGAPGTQSSTPRS